MVKTVLLTLGRLPVALDLARGFSDLGCRVIIAEPFSWHLCRPSRAIAKSIKVTAPNDDSARYLDEMQRVIEAEAVDLVVPVSEEIFHMSALRDRVAPQVQVLCEPQEKLLSVHDKERFIERAQACGLSVPETHRLGTEGAQNLIARGDVVVKNIYSCSGAGMLRLTKGSALPAVKSREPSIVQASVPGRVLSTCSLARSGKVLITSIYEGTQLTGTTSAAFKRVPVHDAVASWVETFVAETNFDGFISFDMIEDASGTPFAIECNPRLTSGVHFMAAEQLAAALVDREQQNDIAFRDCTQFQQFFTCLTEAGFFLVKKNGLQIARSLFGTRDVTWRADDPLPLILMMFTSWEILYRRMTDGVSFGEAAVQDVGWFKDQIVG